MTLVAAVRKRMHALSHTGSRGSTLSVANTTDRDPPADYLLRVNYLWQELRDERAQQADRLSHINGCAGTMLGFESVIIVLITKLAAPIGWRGSAMGLLAASMVMLFWCLIKTPRTGDKEWRDESKGTLCAVRPEVLETWVRMPSGKLLPQLYRNEAAMVIRNRDWLINPKRHTLHIGAYLFIGGLLALGGGELTHLFGG